MIKKSFAVIGIGRFGESVARELIALGADVLVIDNDQAIINKMSSIATYAMICDSTDMDAMKNIGIQNIDHVIVGIGHDIESSIMTTMILSELGVKQITVKVDNDYHAKVVEKLGATEIIRPETQIGKRLARRIVSDNILEYLEVSTTHAFVEVVVTKGSKLIDIPLSELDIRNKYEVNIIAIRHKGEIIIPKANDRIFETDELFLIGSNKAIARFSNMMIK